MVTGSEDLMGTMKKSPRKNWVSIPVSPETNQPTTSNHLEFSPLKLRITTFFSRENMAILTPF